MVMEGHYEISARPLGAVEKLFWLLDQNRPIHFATVALIEGMVPIDTWQDSLDELGWATPRIWSGIAAAPGEQPRFVPVTKLSIPLRRVDGSIADLAHVIQYELRAPFDAKRPPLLRAVVMEDGRRTFLVLCAHHSIADGVSLNYWMQDLLLAVTGHEVEDRIPCASVETMVAQQMHLNALPASPPPPKTRPPIAYRNRYSGGPSVEFLTLDASESEGLVRLARSHGTTVHGALSAAMAAVLKHRLAPRDSGPLRIFSPIDIRRRLLGRSEHLCLCVAGNVIEDDPAADNGWEKARHFSNALAPAKTSDHLLANVGVLEAAMRGVSTAGEAAALFASVLGAETVLTNLGRLDIRTDYGVLRLSALYGPFVSLGFDQEQCVGVCHLDGRIHLSYTSFDPRPAILQELRIALARMAEATG
jgi:hypothetical protein